MADETGSGRSRRGRLTVYLGAAPGVGKTYAMLGEAHRRAERGTDVVVGYVETHGRAHTEEQLDGLEVLPRRHLEHRGTALTELDVDAVLARAPQVVLVDELAHTNAPGGPREKRHEDVEVIRAAGIDVITTVNIQHVESLNDQVRRITGVVQRETVPDEVVRSAEQVQLVDMSPDALRRRLAHGNVYPAERVDASLASFFRVGNLTALRELALLWLADRVDAALGDYRRAHAIEAPWPARERVVVAVTGGPESETLLRRGARLAQRMGSLGGEVELLALHVVAGDGLRTAGEERLAQVQQLATGLGGSFHTVVGEDVPAAVVDFATGADATMVVVGVSRHGRLRRLTVGSTGDSIAELAGAIDVHLVTHDEVARSGARRRAVLSPLSPRRQAVGWLLAVVLPTAVAFVLQATAEEDRLPVAEMLLLAAAVIVALVGGRLPALAAAGVSFVLLNVLLTPPYGTLRVADPANLVSLLVYVAVAAGVASVVDTASRRAAEARRARAEAATLGRLSASVLTGQDTAHAVCERVREAFGMQGVALVERGPAGWGVLARDGDVGDYGAGADGGRDACDVVRIDDDHELRLTGDPLRADDRRVLEGFAVQAGLVLEYRRLRERDERAAALEGAEATSTALLRAVSHDLRTPLATLRTSLDGLAGPGLGPTDRADLLATVDDATTRLQRLIDDLLDLSRLTTGLLRPVLSPRSLDEVLPLAVAGHPDGAVRLEVGEDAPLVSTDAGLLQRVVANLVDNAVRVSAGTPVRVLAEVRDDVVEVLVVDRGPGVPQERRERMFEPFQRLDDTSPGGLGLGLAVARGLADALGVGLVAEDTPGGGLTLVLTIPRATSGAGSGAVSGAAS